MSLFSCCPKKPKKSLDYVIKWVEDTDKIIKDLSDTVQELNNWKEGISEETLKPIFDEYAETYPWDSVPAFNKKADKVENAVQGNFAGLDENGNLIDRGYAPSAFAPADHSHSSISHRKDNKLATIYGYCDAYTPPYFGISLVNEIGNPQSAKSVNLNMNNIDNLARALNTPDSTPTEDSDNLVTSGGVKAAINEVNEKIDNMHTLEYEDDTYLSRMGVGQLNRGDDELDGAFVYGKDAIRLGVLGGLVYIDAENIANLERALKDPSSIPENDATKLITSKAVYDALDGKMDTKTVDSAPANNADHLISSKAVYDALNAKADNPVSLELEKDTTAGYYYLYDPNGENTNNANITSVKALLVATSPGIITTEIINSCKVRFKLGSSGTHYLPGYVLWARFNIIGNTYNYIIKLDVADKSYSCTIRSSSSTVSGIVDSEFPEKWEVTTLSI